MIRLLMAFGIVVLVLGLIKATGFMEIFLWIVLFIFIKLLFSFC